MENKNQRALHPLSDRLGIPLYVEINSQNHPPPLSKTNNEKPHNNNLFKSILRIFLKIRE